MRENDKVALLFEMMCDTDLAIVNRKITEIKMSKEYNRVSEAIVALADSASMKEIVDRYNKLDVDAIVTFERALEVEKEIRRLDEKISIVKNFNPYLSLEENVKEYGVKTVGDINVEISSVNQPVDNFTSKQGVTVNHRRKVMAIKAFTWYKEAKKSIYMMIENSKMFLSRIRSSKVKYGSLSLEFFIAVVFALVTGGVVLFNPCFQSFREGTLNAGLMFMGTFSVYLLLISVIVVTVIKVHYSNYGYRQASKLSKQIAKKNRIVDRLDEASIKFERELMSQISKPHKVSTLVSSVAVLNDDANFSFNEVFEYMYNEKEYYYAKHKVLLTISNIFFALTVIASGLLFALAVLA